MKTSSIKKNFLMNVILTLSSIIFPLITFPYVSRVLLPEGTGKVAFATSVIAYFNMFAQLGIPTYGIRACARVRDDKEKLSKVTMELLYLNVFFAILSSIAFIFSVYLIPKFRSDSALFLIMGITILLNAIGMSWLFQGLEQYTYITIRSVIFKFIALIAMLLLVHDKTAYVIYGGITIFASSASNILNLFYSKKFINYRREKLFPWRHLKYILIFFAMSVATTIYTNLDAVMLGFMSTDIDVGYYNTAVKVKGLLTSIVTSLGAVLLPRSSYYIEHKEYEEFTEISTKALNFVFVIATPLMIYFILFAKQSIYILSGSAYDGSIVPMQIIMPTLLFIGLSNIIGFQILVPTGNEKVVLYSEIAGALTDLIINAILIPNYKSSGAAIGTVVAEFIVLLVQYLFVKDSVNPMLKNISFWKIVIAISISVFASTWVNKLSLNNFLTLITSAIIFFVVYFMSLLAMREKFTKYLFEQSIKKIIRK